MLNLFPPKCADSASCCFIRENSKYLARLFFSLLLHAPTLWFSWFLVFCSRLKEKDFNIAVKSSKLLQCCSGINRDTRADFDVQKHRDACDRFSDGTLWNTNHCLHVTLCSPFSHSSTGSTFGLLTLRISTYRYHFIPYSDLLHVHRELVMGELVMLIHPYPGEFGLKTHLTQFTVFDRFLTRYPKLDFERYNSSHNHSNHSYRYYTSIYYWEASSRQISACLGIIVTGLTTLWRGTQDPSTSVKYRTDVT